MQEPMGAESGPISQETTRPFDPFTSVSSSKPLLQTDLDRLCMAMTNLKVRSPSLNNRSALSKKLSNLRLHKAQTLCVEKAGSDAMAEPGRQTTQQIARAIDKLARKRKSKKARARAKARAKARQQSSVGIVTCNRGDYVAQIQLHS